MSEALFQPALIHSVSGLALISRNIVDEYLAGVNRSVRTGSGMEFSQYRPYEPGDDLRMLDWKLVARKDKYYIRQSEIESATTVNFILDTSASMQQQSGLLTKIDYARVIIATLAYLASQQGDAIGLFARNDKNISTLTPERKRQQYMHLLDRLISIKPDARWPGPGAELRHIVSRKEKTLIFFISDMYEHDSEIMESLQQLNTSNSEVIVLHIIAAEEEKFSFEGALTLEDLETGERVKIDAREAREKFESNWKEFRKNLSNNLLHHHIDYFGMPMNEPIQQVIQHFIRKKNSMVR